MRSFSKKLAFVLAAAMVFTAFAPAAKAEAADEMTMNKSAVTIYLNEGVNDHGAETCPTGLYGNIQEYDFYVKNKPANWKTDCKFAWASSDEKVATVDNKGLVTPLSVGKTEISCVVTDAANKATTVKATVTVKANAADVLISNAEDYDGLVIPADRVVDLNRTMYAEGVSDGTTKRGVEVTDYTRWIALDPNGEKADAAVVAINQSNGQFTFAADAPAGEYTLYCETYQSSKYTQTTATSDMVVVIVEGENTFTAKQDTVTKFTINFENKVAKLGAVTVDRIFVNGDVTFPLEAAVKSATLAKDGMSATVEMFSALADKTLYNIYVEGFEEAFPLTASQGAPETIKIYVDAKNVKDPAELVAVNAAPIELKYALYDANEVDVTEVATGSVLFTPAKYATDGSYYVNGDGKTGQIWFAKEDVEVDVVAEYQTGKYENGQPVGNKKTTKTFISYKEAPVTVVGLADYKIAGTKADWSDAAKTVPFGKTATLDLLITLSKTADGKPVAPSAIPNGAIVVEEVTPNVAALNGNNVVFFQKNVDAKFVVYHVYNDGTKDVKNALGIVTVKATDAVALSSISLDATGFTLGTVAGFDDKTVTVKGKDNYGADMAVTAVTLEGLDDNSKKALAATGAVTTTGGKIYLSGAEMLGAIANASAAQFTFKVKATDTISTTLSVTVKKPVEGSTYISIEADGFGKDIARTVKDANTKAAKVGKFTVYTMSNGVTTGIVTDLAKYNKDAVSAGKYYFTVQKDGKDVTDKVDVANGVVTINFSGTKDEAATSGGKIVTYDLGAGNYVFTLFKGVQAGDKAVGVQQNVASGAVTCNLGAYGAAVKAKETVTDDSAATIRAALTIKDTAGNDATSFYTVQSETAGNYVYVTSVTFYDEVATDVYAKYVVPVGFSFKIVK